jgi:uncharacterized protein with NRDE domain
MCTLIVLHRCVSGRPLVIAANRDEYLDRPAEGPGLRSGPSGSTLSPRDLQEGGTWLGVGPAGLFAGITNRPCPNLDPKRRSRGLLVQDALAAPDAAAAAEAFERIPAGAYNPFNLLVADGRDAFVAVYEGEVKVRSLQPGVHVIGNADPNDRDVPKVARLLIEAGRAAEVGADAALDALAQVCRQHRGSANPLEDTCIHTDAPRGAYGTRSSALLSYDAPARPARLLFADGPPCRTDYEDFTPLLRELRIEAESRRENDARSTL